MTDIQKFASFINESKNIVFFTGAGVSTESGLKDYRSKDGIYNTAKNYGLPPEQILSHTCFFRNTELFYRFYRDYFIVDAKDNITHKSIAKLEQTGKNISVVTQNIDGLHQKAGSTSVFELHGNASKFFCTKCGKKFTLDYVKNSPQNVPLCDCKGIIKPYVTLYEEPLDDGVVYGAIDSIRKADLLVIGGTSLAVFPAASFVRYFGGDKIVIINKETTQYDNAADIVFHDSIGKVLGDVIKELGI